MMLRIARSILFLILMFQAMAAYSWDPQLLRLVPGDSEIVAGLSHGQLSSFLLVTRNNQSDRKDFSALTGGDATRVIREIIFVAAYGKSGELNEHSLLVSGHFDRASIFRFADHGATLESYRGVPILAVPAFARERATLNELRWLAILDDKIAIFGSVDNVQQELDRWVRDSLPEPWLVERLSRLGSGDNAWCLLPAHQRGGAVAKVLAKLDPRLGAIADDGGSIQYGIHFGRTIEITLSSNPEKEMDWKKQDVSSGAEPMAVSHFMSTDNSGTDVPKAIVKISLKQYKTWLDEYSNGGPVAGHSN